MNNTVGSQYSCYSCDMSLCGECVMKTQAPPPQVGRDETLFTITSLPGLLILVILP